MRTHAERSQVGRRPTTDTFSGSPRKSSTRGHPPGSILHLQRTIGNRATARRLRTPELVLGSPDDRWEREADRWHSIFSVELVGGTWTRVDTPSGRPNEIELGSTSPRGATP